MAPRPFRSSCISNTKSRADAMQFPLPQGRDFHDTMGEPRHGREGGHRGQDLPAPLGSPIVAMKSGRVVRVYDRLAPGQHCGYGLSVESAADRIRYTYCHMHVPPTREDGTRWAVGDEVAADDFLGVVGMTGSATGPHLHIQGIRNSGRGQPVNLYGALRAAYMRQLGRPPEPFDASGVPPRARAPQADAGNLGAFALVAAVAWWLVGRG
jgi:murein DD-endopeptidase MepM/ murein hydrolase activator NlpD